MSAPTPTPTPSPTPSLMVNNSLTRSKVPFTSLSPDGRSVTWYMCGPTVYDSAHLGHARTYVTSDVIRRVLEDYFRFNVHMVMNVTDVDDKIIVKARREHLMQVYSQAPDMATVLVPDTLAALAAFAAKTASLTQEVLQAKRGEEAARVTAVLSTITGQPSPAQIAALEEAARGILSEWLDVTKGHLVTDLSIFTAVPRRFEQEFLSDMRALNVRPPDVLTRVSEYIPEVLDYVARILHNGYAYNSNGSVYFDTEKFKATHKYAKLSPEKAGDQALNDEAEGSLSLGGEKKHPNDFALWKKSKQGEPSWDSAWGLGRPGWHIECSAMASAVLGSCMDVHSGGIDLRFPHHDNEIAQAEAYYCHHEWVRYFLHCGHLDIEGCKMSKSLKNFVTIGQALQLYSARQLRFLFLLHAWDCRMDYGNNAMNSAVLYEKLFSEFFLNIKAELRKEDTAASAQKWTSDDFSLNQLLIDTRRKVHASLCDNFNTGDAVRAMAELVKAANVYLLRHEDCRRQEFLLRAIASYISKILSVFGLMQDDSFGFASGSGGDSEDVLSPFLDAFAVFRDLIRTAARQGSADPGAALKSILSLCDDVRDDTMVELGVRLEDQGNHSIWKLGNKEELRRERDRVRLEAEAKAKKKEEARLEMAKKEMAKLEAAKVRPQDMFRQRCDEFSRFDESGVPTHDGKGEPLSKGAAKKILKEWEKQVQVHEEWVAKSQPQQ